MEKEKEMRAKLREELEEPGVVYAVGFNTTEAKVIIESNRKTMDLSNVENLINDTLHSKTMIDTTKEVLSNDTLEEALDLIMGISSKVILKRKIHNFFIGFITATLIYLIISIVGTLV